MMLKIRVIVVRAALTSRKMMADYSAAAESLTACYAFTPATAIDRKRGASVRHDRGRISQKLYGAASTAYGNSRDKGQARLAECTVIQ